MLYIPFQQYAMFSGAHIDVFNEFCLPGIVYILFLFFSSWNIKAYKTKREISSEYSLASNLTRRKYMCRTHNPIVYHLLDFTAWAININTALRFITAGLLINILCL